MGIRSDELGQIRDRSLHIDCPTISMINASGDTELSGSGYIRELKEGKFELRLLLPDRADARRFFEPLMSSFMPGKLLGSDQYCSFRATDIYGRAWHANHVPRPTYGGSLGGIGYVATAKCDEIECKENESSKRAWVTLLAYQDAKFPKTVHTERIKRVGSETIHEGMSLTAARFSACGFEFRIEVERGEFTVRATSTDERLHPYAASRISESLLFALGVNYRWAVISYGDRDAKITKVRSHKSRPSQRERVVPLRFSDIEHVDEVWNLFELYLKYVCLNRELPFHRVSAEVLSVAKLSDASVEAIALSSVVAVEALLDQFYSDTGNPTDETKREIGLLINYLEAWDGNALLVGRAKGSISQMKSARPGDRLRALVKAGLVSEAKVAAWVKLRNSVAHGDWSGVKQLQEFLDRIGDVQSLFYQLIAHLIGYSGPLTDWGARGWPDAMYPPLFMSGTS